MVYQNIKLYILNKRVKLYSLNKFHTPRIFRVTDYESNESKFNIVNKNTKFEFE